MQLHTILANYVGHFPSTGSDPNTRMFAVCISHHLVLQAPILFLLLGLTGQTTALHLPSSKPQAAAYAMKFEGLRAETELVEQGSQISRGSCDTFNWGNFSLSLVIMHIKP